MGPDEELLGVVVHSGLILARHPGAVVALRRITAFPAGLSLDVTVLARDVHAEAANRREREAMTHRQAEAAARRQDEVTAQLESTETADKEGLAAAGRAHARRQAMIEWQHLPRFGQGDTLRMAVLTPTAGIRWLDAYQLASSSGQDRYRLEASYWAAPLPEDGLLTLACAWPEIGLPETQTDVVLPDLAARAAEARAVWTWSQDP
jgi:hypothetical protein